MNALSDSFRGHKNLIFETADFLLIIGFEKPRKQQANVFPFFRALKAKVPHFSLLGCLTFVLLVSGTRGECGVCSYQCGVLT
jgi:hypothetical protein